MYLYVLVSDGFYKIGVANDVAGRIAQLSTGNPHEIALYQYWEFPNAVPVEQALQQRFESSRVRGEWFRLTDADLDVLGLACLQLGGVIAGPLEADEETLEDHEEIQEFLLDNPDYRVEKRCKNGEVRGYALRKRGPGREVVRYIGKREHPVEFATLLAELGK